MAKKLYDVAIKTGEYEKNGETKGRYKNLGAVFQGDKGPYLLLDSTYVSMQLFALVNKDRRDSVLCSMFEPKESAQAPANDVPAAAALDPDDDLPF